MDSFIKTIKDALFSKTDADSHDSQAADRFDKWADKYGEDRISPWFLNNQKQAISRLDIAGNGNFLDVGCGTGRAVWEVSKYIDKGIACGIDISPKMIEKAKRFPRGGNNTKTEFSVASAEKIPYPDKYFRYMMCTCSFHHYKNPLKALTEMKRVMAPDGKLIIIESGRDIFFPIWLQDRYRRIFEKSHVRYYTIAEIKQLFLEAKLSLAGEIQIIKRTMFHKKLFTGLMIFEIVNKINT